jgi:hypothetical protein
MNTNTVEKASVTPEKSAHTPGPWETRPGYYGTGSTANVVEDSNGNNIAHLDQIMWAHPEDESVRRMQANARLIAAAPSMLQALKDLTGKIQLWKLNVRKDFSLLNAHATATKAIWQAETTS